MLAVSKEEILDVIFKCNNLAQVIFINPRELVLEEQVRFNCFYCAKYGNNWKCPPNLPQVDYRKMFSEFDEGAFVCLSYEIEDYHNFVQIRNDSSVELHRILLEVESWLWNHNRSTALSFGGGSCKLCKGGCGENKCNNPYKARSPLEATGVNVVKSAKKYGVEIKFPVNKELKRIGLIVWQS